VRSVNEDLALESLSLFAVADGMGGHVGGEIAARTAIDTLRTEFGRAPTADGLVGAVHQANLAVWEAGHADPSLRGMGTTLVAAALVGTEDGDRLVLANVGDSRAYRLHGRELAQLSIDHSVAEELVARGELSEEEAAVHPHRHILTRALGVAPDIDVDVWDVTPEEGDRFLLCSDGLSNEVPAEQITDVLISARDPRDAAGTLVDLANRAGGNDNITVVVLDVVVGDRPSVEHDGSSTGEVPATPPAPDATSGPDAGLDTVDGAAGAMGTAPPGGATGPGPDSSTEATAASATATAAPGTATALATPGLRPDAPAAPGTTAPTTRNGAGTAVVGRSSVPAAGGRTGRHERHPGVHVPRRITFRVVLFVVLLAGVVYAGYAVIRWYVNNSYYVGLDHHSVVIYQGRRGGFVGIQPKIVKRYIITTGEVPSFDVAPLKGGVEEPSLKAAENYVTQLQQEPCILQGAPASCATTSTLAPGPTSTVAPGPGSTSTSGAPPLRSPASPTRVDMPVAA